MDITLEKLLKKRDLRIGLVGIGKSSVGVYEYLKGRCPDVKVTLRSNEAAEIDGLVPERSFFGKNAYSNIDEDILFFSPSARRDVPQVIEAKKRGVILSSDAEMFFLLSKADVYAVTGSDGKSTTTYLCSKLLEDSYTSVIPAGNFGEPLSRHIEDAHGTAVVAELSSFQLNYMKPKSQRCVITNISKNHLNWHSSFGEYIEAKGNILDNACERVYNADCNISCEFMKTFPAFSIFSLTLDEKDIRKKYAAELYIYIKDGKV